MAQFHWNSQKETATKKCIYMQLFTDEWWVSWYCWILDEFMNIYQKFLRPRQGLGSQIIDISFTFSNAEDLLSDTRFVGFQVFFLIWHNFKPLPITYEIEWARGLECVLISFGGMILSWKWLLNQWICHIKNGVENFDPGQGITNQPQTTTNYTIEPYVIFFFFLRHLIQIWELRIWIISIHKHVWV